MRLSRPTRDRLGRWLLPLPARLPYSLLAALLLVRFADEWFSFFPAGAIEAIREDLGLSYAAAGLILAAPATGGLLGHGLHVAADFVDRRLLASLGALVFGLCLLAFAAGQTLALLLAAGFVWGVASDAFIGGCEVTLVDVYRDNVATVLGRVNAYGAVGDLLGPLTLAGAAAIGLGWRSVFALGGVLMLLYAVWLGRRQLPAPQPPEAEHSPVTAVTTIARDRRVVLLALVDGLYSLLDEPFQGFLIAYFVRVRGFPAALSTTIVGVAVVAAILGFLAVPLLNPLAPRTRLFLLGAVVAVAVALLVVAPYLPVLLLAAFGFGAGGAVFYATLQAAELNLHPGYAGATQAVVSTIGLFGIAFPALVGALSDARGLTTGLAAYAAVPPLVLLLLALDAALAGRCARAA